MKISSLIVALTMLPAIVAFGDDAKLPPTAARNIPFDQLGAEAQKQYAGDGITITPTQDGAKLKAIMQRIEGEATPEGLWLTSTADEDGGRRNRFRVKAIMIGRDGRAAGPPAAASGPAFTPLTSAALAGASALPSTGFVRTTKDAAAWLRPGLVEEYSVSTDGVRQDFVVLERPLGDDGALVVDLEVTGAHAASANYGAKLIVNVTGRELAYSRLKVTDATGRELTAHLDVVNPERMRVMVTDTGAVYPVRIDPTFSDADWVSMGGNTGTDSQVYALAVDGFGNLYIGGLFTVAGTVAANNIAKWNGSGWSALGSGTVLPVRCITVSGTDVYVGGDFASAGGVANTSRLAKWNGTTWSSVLGGLNSFNVVYAIAVVGSRVYVGGDLGGPGPNNVQIWNGTGLIQPGTTNGIVYALAVSGTNVYVGGDFTTAGGVTVNRIARLSDTTFTYSAVGTGTNGTVRAIAVNSPFVYVGGDFTTAGAFTVNRVAMWHEIASTWNTMGSGMNNSVRSLLVSGSTVYAGGSFTTAGGTAANYVAAYSGGIWNALNTGTNFETYALALSGGNVYVGGSFSSAGGVWANNVARWNGSAWSTLSPVSGVDRFVYALAATGTDLYVAGAFNNAGGASANQIAKWNGSAWSALGSGTNARVQALAVSGSDLYAGGLFTTAGGASANYVAKWNGTAWSALGSGMAGTSPSISALKVSGSDLYAGGSFTSAGGVTANSIAKWNGSAWAALGAGMDNSVLALETNGTDLYAAGQFTTAGAVSASRIARWDGSNWSALGAGIGGTSPFVKSLAVMAGEIYVGGSFSAAGGTSVSNVACWSGSAWSSLGSGVSSTVNALAVRGSELFAAGSFSSAGGGSASNIARWNGAAWSALGSGLDSSSQALALNGVDLYVGGFFSKAGGKSSAYFARAGLGTPPPIVVRGTATSVTGTAATLNGTVNPNGITSTAQFEYGTTTSYGSTATVTLSPDNGSSAQNVSANVAGLTPGTLYHFLLTATNGAGTTSTTDGTFTTLSNNANLSGLVLSVGTLSPSFASGTTSYTASVTFSTATLTITPTREQANATIKVNGNTVASGSASAPINLNVGSNTVTTIVTAQDGTAKTYTATVTRRAVPGPGDRDFSFDSDGIVTTAIGSSDEFGTSMAVQSDGKIVVAGYSDNGTNDFALVRHLAGGALDTSFGVGGKVTTPVGNSNDIGRGVVVQSDGKIVVAGSSLNINSNLDFAVVRYTAGGALDTSFGAGGKVTTAIGNSHDFGSSMALQSDGKIVVAGSSSNGSNYDFALVRYTVSGALDTSFGAGGKVTTPIGSGDDQGEDVAVQSDGKIVVAGWCYNGGNRVFAVVRYTSSGVLDNTFGTGGIVTTAIGSSDDVATSVVVRSNGKIVVGGYSWNGSNNEVALVTYASDGTLDSGFGTGGKVTTAIGNYDYDYQLGLAVQTDGRIVVVGKAGLGINSDIALLRYTVSGVLDNTFGNGGKVTTSIGTTDDRGNSVALQSDGNIVVAGYYHNGSNYDFALVRYLGGPYPPVVQTLAASNVLTTTATLNGTVNPNGFDSTAQFEYGTTTSYGSTVSVTLSPTDGTTAQNVSANLIGLTPGTLYHYRLTATNAGGTSSTSDATFTTLSNNANLSNLVLSAGSLSPVFASGTTSYTASVPYTTTSITVTPTREQANATIKVNGNTVASGSASAPINLNVGSNTVTTIVTAQDGTPKTYTVTVTRAAAGPGDRDFSFDSDGIVTTPIGTSNESAQGVVVQGDGKIVAAGYNYNGTNNDFALVRYNANGSLDASFNGTGKVTTDFGGDDQAYAIALQSDGKIVLVGKHSTVSGTRFAVARYHPNGNLDTDFNGTGKAIMIIGGSSDQAFGVAIQSDGKIVVVGSAVVAGGYDFAVVRYETYGMVDLAFGTNGVVTTPIGPATEEAHAVVLQSDGKIVAAGYASNGSTYDFALVRYTTTGVLDTTFNGTGKVITPFGAGATGNFNGVAVQSDGRIVAVGSKLSGGLFDTAVVRYTPVGTLDTTFNSTGLLLFSLVAGNDEANAVALQRDGKILVAGYAGTAPNGDFALTRLTATGALDTTFFGTGKVTTPIGSGNDAAYGMALQSDGGIVLAGVSSNGSNNDFALVRYLGGPYPPTATTLAATNVLSTTVTLNGSANPNGLATTAWFEYGTTTSYGNMSSFFQSLGSGTSAVPATANITGLTPGTLYHCRVVTQNAEGTTNGNDITFTTQNNNANLANLIPSAGTLTPAFSSGTTSYTSTVSNTTTSIVITPTVADSTATVKVNGVTVASGSASGSIALAVGSNTITTVVTAQDVNVTKTYTLIVTRASAPEIRVFAGANDTAPELTDGQMLPVDFGSTLLGTPITRTFTVKNVGTADLHVTSMIWQDPYQVAGNVAALGVIPPGMSGTFQLRFLANTVHGTFSGTLSIINDDPDEAPFDFPVTAIATGTVVQGGGLDTSFGSGGKVITPFGSSSAVGKSLVVQSDGKIVVAGSSYSSSNSDFALVRYTSTGALDSSFGSGGKVTTAIGSSDDNGNSVALQSDGRIIVAGFSYNGTNDDFALVRYNADGTLDSGFGTGGKVTTAIGSSYDRGGSVAVQSDGKIVVAGPSMNGSNWDFALVRYHSNGALDSGFGSGGKVATSIGSSDDFGYSVVVQADGKIVVAGSSYNGSNYDFALVRYDANGTLDSGFGSGGKVTTPIGSSDDVGLSAAVQSDGRIIVAGFSYNGSNNDFALVRYDANGTLDSGFGSGGKVTAAIGSGNDVGNCVVPQDDGKIVVAGASYNGSNYDFALVRHNANGTLDSTFGSGGKVTNAIGSSDDQGSSVALQSGGKIIVAGYSYNGSNNDFALVRYDGGTTMYPAPATSTAAASSLGTTAATLNGTVNPNGIITSAWFQWGTTTNYGQTTATEAQGYGTGANPVNAALTGLTPNTLYHYRIVGQNGETTAYGADMTFTTLTVQQGWRQLYFGTSSNSGNAADGFDYDKDGLPNLIEWACNLNPTTASTLPVTTTRNGAAFEFTYTRSVAAVNAGAVFTVEWSDTLPGPNPWSATGVTQQILSDNGTVQQVKATVPVGSSGQRFVRLKVTGPP